jgi:hypothetical protein
MLVWLRLAGPAVSVAAPVPGSDKLGAAIWNSPVPTVDRNGALIDAQQQIARG